MKGSRIQIDELRLRASGLSREDARRLGNVVAKRLVDLPVGNGRQRNISSLKVRVQSSGTKSLESMADTIDDAIRRSLK